MSGSGGQPMGGGGSGGLAGCSVTGQWTLGAIATVGVVTFSVSGVANIQSAKIDFAPATGGSTMSANSSMTAPVDLTQPDHRTLLLGMKPRSTYTFRIAVTGSAGTCTSADYTLTTGPVPDTVSTTTDGFVNVGSVPSLDVDITNAAAHDRGFIIATAGQLVLILDPDGAPVWWAAAGFDGTPDAPATATRGHMSWDGRQMYVLRSGPPNPGVISKIEMDGSGAEILSGASSHHDFTAIPGGIATLVGTGSVVERASDGTITTVVADLGTFYDGGGHTNAIHYYPWNDSYTISDLLGSVFVRITRKGELVWQLGGTMPKDPSKAFSGAVTWHTNHGHQLLPDGTFLFFNNVSDPGDGGNGVHSLLRVLALDTMAMTASAVFTYTIVPESAQLGDVQRLPNGNYLITAPGKQLTEITATGDPVMTIKGITSAYSEFRQSLYGPPPY